MVACGFEWTWSSATRNVVEGNQWDRDLSTLSPASAAIPALTELHVTTLCIKLRPPSARLMSDCGVANKSKVRCVAGLTSCPGGKQIARFLMRHFATPASPRLEYRGPLDTPSGSSNSLPRMFGFYESPSSPAAAIWSSVGRASQLAPQHQGRGQVGPCRWDQPCHRPSQPTPTADALQGECNRKERSCLEELAVLYKNRNRSFVAPVWLLTPPWSMGLQSQDACCRAKPGTRVASDRLQTSPRCT